MLDGGMIYFGQGNSGWPFIAGASLVEASAEAEIRLGDLAVFDSGPVPTCHRVLAKKNLAGVIWYLFKGDANPAFDGWVPAYRVHGKVVAIDGKAPRQLLCALAWTSSWLFLPYLWQRLRKGIGLLVFGFIRRPPGSLAVNDGGDYGHADFHDALIIRDSSDLQFALRTMGPAPQRILDLGGGSGRLAIPLVQAGHLVCLAEKSQTMLNRARERRAGLSETQRTQWEIKELDLRTWHAQEKYAHVFLLNNVLEHLSDDEEVMHVLRQTERSLETEGRLYLDVHHLAYFQGQSDWLRGRWRYHADGKVGGRRYRLWSRTLKGAGANSVLVEHTTRHGSEPFRVSQLRLRPRAVEDWAKLFQRSGLKILANWGNWRGAPLAKHFPKAIFILGRDSEPT